jgi:hypothetical protein
MVFSVDKSKKVIDDMKRKYLAVSFKEPQQQKLLELASSDYRTITGEIRWIVEQYLMKQEEIERQKEQEAGASS